MFWGPIIASVIGAAGSMMANRGQSQTQQGSNSQSNVTKNTYNPNEALMPSYNNLYGLINYLSGQQMPFFPGPTYTGPSLGTQFGVNSLMDAANGQDITNSIAAGNYGFLSNAADVANNPYVQGMLGVNRERTNQALTEDWLPAISNQAQQVNALGSGRAGLAQAQGIERASTQLSQANRELMNQAYGQGLGAQQFALGQTGALNDAFAQPGQTRVAAGNLVEGYQQRALQDAMARFAHQYQQPWTQANNLASLLGLPAAYNTGLQYGSSYGQGNSTYPNPGYMSPFASAMGGASMGMGIYDAWQRSQRPQYDPSVARMLSSIF